MLARALAADISGAPVWRAVRLILATALVFAAAYFSLTFSSHGERVTPVWTANAIVLAFCLKAKPQRWFEILAAGFLGNVAADVLCGDTLVESLCLSFSNTVEALVCANLIDRLVGPTLDLTRRRDLTVFVGVCAAGSILSALLAAGLIGLFKSQGEGVVDVPLWAMADAVGAVMVAPVLLMLADVRAQLLAQRMTLSRLGPLALLAAGTGVVFGQSTYPLIFLIPPLWAYAASELEFIGLTAGAAIVGTLSVGFTVLGHGPVMLVPGDANHKILMLQGFIAFSTVAMLQFTSSVIQRRRLTRSLQVMHRQAEKSRESAVEDHRRAQMAEAVAGLGYWRIDLKTGTIDWSSQVYALFDIPRSEAPRAGAVSELIHPEDAEEARAAFQQICATGEPRHMEARIITRTGRTRIVRSWATAEKDAKGAVSAILYVMMDVTDQRRVESELRQARDAAEQAAEVKAEFLANMSHELRTPLTSIIGFTDLASTETEMPKAVRHYIDRVAAASKALLALVNDVLDFSKLEAGEIRLQPRPVDMRELGREVIDLFGAQASAKHIRLELDVVGDIPQAVALDADRLRQVLINLAGNAVKFTSEGGVTLRIAYDRGAGVLSGAVIDTGPGISPDRLSSLFKRFSQVDASSTRVYGGTGLGLAICKGLIEAMGGQIGVETHEGAGSRFWFDLPAEMVDPAETADAEVVDAPSIGARFLVVDDNRANRDLVRAILASLGAEIVEACDGLEAVKAAMQAPFDVILMDMRMPGLSGPEAVAEIRRGGPNAASPIIAFSASADPREMEALHLQGFDGCLPKPFTLTDLIQTVEKAMARPGDDDLIAERRRG